MKRLAKQWQENKDMITVDKYLKYANTREKSLTELVQKDAAMSRRIKLRRQKKSPCWELNSSLFSFLPPGLRCCLLGGTTGPSPFQNLSSTWNSLTLGWPAPSLGQGLLMRYTNQGRIQLGWPQQQLLLQLLQATHEVSWKSCRLGSPRRKSLSQPKFGIVCYTPIPSPGKFTPTSLSVPKAEKEAWQRHMQDKPRVYPAERRTVLFL